MPSREILICKIWLPFQTIDGFASRAILGEAQIPTLNHEIINYSMKCRTQIVEFPLFIDLIFEFLAELLGILTRAQASEIFSRFWSYINKELNYNTTGSFLADRNIKEYSWIFRHFYFNSIFDIYLNFYI